MGRGGVEQASSGRQLLYGPRRGGPGPDDVAYGLYNFDKVRQLFAARKLPEAVNKYCAELSFRPRIIEAHEAKIPNYPHRVVNCQALGLSSVANKHGERETLRLALSFYQAPSGPRIILNHGSAVPMRDHRHLFAEPGVDEEQRFLAGLAQSIFEREAMVKMAISNRDAFEAAYLHYPGSWQLSTELIDDDVSEGELLNEAAMNLNLSDDQAEAMFAADSLDQLLDSDHGCQALDVWLSTRGQDLYIARRLADFARPLDSFTATE